MFWPFRKKVEEVRDEVSEQKVIDKLKGESYSPNSFRIEIRVQAGKTYYVAQKKYSFSTSWTDMDMCNTEQEARATITRSKEYDYKYYLEQQEKNSAIVINHIDV